MVGSTPHLLPGMPVWVRNHADPTSHTPSSWSRAVLVKPEPGPVVISWAARLADDPLHRRNVSVPIEDLLSRSEDEDEAMSGNLTALREVSEPEVMSALLRRFNVDQVFTYAGPVLVSLKPNRPLPLYDLEHQRQFHFAVMNESRAATPHLYSIGGRAYRAMVKDQLSQTVLLCGAAGSGKSHASRMLLRQLVECSTLRGDESEGGRPFDSATMLTKIEAATELMRLMGSVSLPDSPDCNRYIMVTEGQFDAQPALVGVSFMAELLDKSPLTTGHQGHSFHMLHLLSEYGASNFKFLHIDPGTEFRYLGGKTNTQISPVTSTLIEAGGKQGPLRNWDLAIKSLDLLEVSRNETSFFLQLLAAVLHLGNLDFVNEGVVEGRRVEESHMTRAMPSDLGLFKLICQLLWLEEELVLECLVGKHPDQVNLCNPGEVFKGRLPTATQAQANCDLLAQTVYQVAFEFIVAAANEKLACVSSDGLVAYHLNVVDTPGLTNDSSFGSLCCNLMYEMVQDRIWRTFLADPRSKLQSEGIENSVQVTNARSVLSVLDQGSSGPGVLPILSEIHSMTKETLKLLLTKMVEGGEPSQSVITDVEMDSFRICHTGSSIKYDSELILAGCGGLFGLDISVVLQQSGNRILRGGASMLENSTNAYSNFKKSADNVLNSMNPYSTHVIQTVNPSFSGEQAANKGLVASQVDASVLLPLLEWEKNGFSEWIPHGQFVREYRYLLSDDDLSNMLLRDLCRKVLAATLPPDAYAIGARHILLKGDKTRALAAHLEARREAAAVAIQARARGVIGRIRFRKLWRIKNAAANNMKRVMRGAAQRSDYAAMRERTLEAQRLLSRTIKGHLSRLDTINHRPTQYFGKGYCAWNKGLSLWEKAYHAALTFKRMYRGHATRKWFWGYTEKDGTEMIGFREWKLDATICVQRYYRGYLGRRRANALATRVYAACVIQECFIKHLVRRNAYMTRIQRWWRAIMAERAFGWVHNKLTEAAVQIQRVFRGHKGRDLAAKCHGVQACADLWFAATRIQRWIRPMLARIREIRRNLMATKIQRAWRSAVARAAWLWVHCQLNDSATQITKAFRGWRSRKKTLALKASIHSTSYLDGPGMGARAPKDPFATGQSTARSEVSDYHDYESGADTDRSIRSNMQTGGVGMRPRKPKFSLSQPCAPNMAESRLIERRKAGAEPFTPAINEKSAGLKRSGKVEDRLEQAHRSHLERMEAQRRAKLEADMEQNAGVPRMNKNSKRITKSLGNIDERFPKYQRQARINLEKAREEQGKHEEATLTFHPKITKPAQAMERTPEVWEQWYKDKYKRLKDLERAVRAQEDQDLRAPQISRGTARIAAKRKDADKKVYDRLYAYQGKYRENRENLIREEEQKFTETQMQATKSRARPSYRPKKGLAQEEEDAPRGSQLFSSMGLQSGVQHSYTPTVNARSTEIMRKKQQQALQMLEGGGHTMQATSRMMDSVTGKGHTKSLDQWNTMLSSFKEDFDR